MSKTSRLHKQELLMVNSKANLGPRVPARREQNPVQCPQGGQSEPWVEAPASRAQGSHSGPPGAQWPDSESTSMSAAYSPFLTSRICWPLGHWPSSPVPFPLFKIAVFWLSCPSPITAMYWVCWGGTPYPGEVMRSMFISNRVEYSIDFCLSPRGKEV